MIMGAKEIKVTELTIGDWVMSTEPFQVQYIYNDGYGDCIGDIEAIYADDFDEKPYRHRLEIYLKSVTPIILTPEILEKNGFEFVKISNDLISSTKLLTGDTTIQFQFMDEECYFRIDHCGKESSYEIRKYINYVHELQHLLRLCGLDELADNFKVYVESK